MRHAPTDRREFLRLALTAAGGAALGTLGMRALGAQGAQGALPVMTVYKSAQCGCCSLWVEHATANGFTVRVVNTEDLGSVKREMGIPPRLASCHTVVLGGYLVEGHVPAADIKRLLAQKPRVRGLAVPGMPVGAPGMEQGSPANYERYDVVAFSADGRTSVFATHGPPARR
jgi:hypothetical protein